MEQTIKIRIPGTKLSIYGKLRGSLKKPLVILVHGLAGEMDERLIFQAAHWFENKGYATFRYNQYDWHPNARSMTDITLKIQARDLDTVISYFAKRGASKIFLVGHSYGAPTVLMAKKLSVTAIALWDPSYKTNLVNRDPPYPSPKYVRQVRGYVNDWGFDVIIGEKMAKESQKLDWDSLVHGLKIPVKILCAGKGMLVAGGKRYFSQARVPKEFSIIKGASHQFVEDGAVDRLLVKTAHWFKKFNYR